MTEEEKTAELRCGTRGGAEHKKVSANSQTLHSRLLTSVCACVNEPISSLHVFSELTVADLSKKASVSRANVSLIRVRSGTHTHVTS